MRKIIAATIIGILAGCGTSATPPPATPMPELPYGVLAHYFYQGNIDPLEMINDKTRWDWEPYPDAPNERLRFN